MKKITRTLAILIAAAMASASVSAQNPYDDLYYSPSKAAKEKKEKEELLRRQQAAARSYSTADYAGADAYTAGSAMPLQIDVDAYNRRSGDPYTGATDSLAAQADYNYTRRLERFHNPEVVTSTGDTELIEQYYSSSAAAPEVNIYVIDNDPFNWNRPAWAWGPSVYYPWRYSYWGPSWSFGWGYDPWFDFSWGSPWYGPSWGWGWGWTSPGWAPRPPHHHPGWAPGHGPSHGWAVNSPGASRPHRPSAGASSTSSRRPSYGNWNYPSSARPGNMGTTGNRRPSTSSPAVSGNSRPSSPSQGSSARPSNNSRRGSGTNSNSNSNYRNPSPSRNSTPAYRPSNNGSRGYSGGGSRGGGGAGRGRR